MAWSELGTVQDCLDCKPPFSFYFDLIAARWKTPGGNPNPLHRICTLARKQGAHWLVIESALPRPEIQEDIEALDQVFGGGGAAEAVAISFLCCEERPNDINVVSESDFLGQVVFINYRQPEHVEFTHSYVYEAVLTAPCLPGMPRKELLNNFICSDGKFPVAVGGRQFDVQGIYYCQQNSVTHVCAHASLRMGLNTVLNGAHVTNAWINDFIKVTPPIAVGLSLQNIHDVLESHAIRPMITNCDNLSPSVYLSVLASIVESGFGALLVFTTGTTAGNGGGYIEHVVTVFGHTRNSDEWHPQALPAYSGPRSAHYYPSSSWVDHFLIHDDNFGPYYTLSSRAFEADVNVKARWIVGLYPSAINMYPSFTEATAAVFLANVLPAISSLSSGRWFEYITRSQWKYVLRTILIKKADYINHLAELKAHDQSVAAADEISGLKKMLPDQFWMVEYTLPALMTGNRSKLGEILLDAELAPDPNDQGKLVLGIRLPGLWLVKDAAGQFGPRTAGIKAHGSMFWKRAQNHVW